MLWISLAIASYFFSALSQVVDKILLQTRLPSPTTYAFYTGLTSIFVIVLMPFGFAILPLPLLAFALVTGIVFIFAIYFLYASLHLCDVSRIVPIIGGAIPIFLLLFSWAWFGQTLNTRQFASIVFFLLGGLILATEVKQHAGVRDSLFAHLLGAPGHRLAICGRDTGKGIATAFAAAFFFALTYFMSKQIYESPADFVPEFFWIRIGSVVGALGMLLLPSIRKIIFETTPTITKSSATMLFGNKVIGASSFLLLNMSFSLAENQNYIVVINAMKGLEHFFVFLFSLFLTIMYPRVLREMFDRHTIILKLTGIALIGFGFVYLL